MTEELFAAFGPAIRCPKTERRLVWLMRESFMLIDEMLIQSKGMCKYSIFVILAFKSDESFRRHR